MATFLRCARHARIPCFILQEIRCNYSKIARNKANFFKNNDFKRNLVRAYAVQSMQQRPDYNLQRLDNTLNKLDMNARRLGRIALKDVEQLLSEIKITGKATSNQCSLAIRCCGNLLPDELLKTRTKLVTDIWNTLEELKCPLDVSHYNVLLKVYLENEHKFSPTEFLSAMESKGIVPNRVTYQRLIAHYCQQGDIEGAGKILEYMKEKDLPINENVFNALIIGHARANDMESAKGILNVMKNAKLEPGTNTYATLIYAYAEKGDMEKMLEVYNETEKLDIFLPDECHLETVYILAKNGHSQHVGEVINKMRKFAGFNQDATATILRLVNINQDEVAFQLLRSLPPATTADGTVAPSGHFMIRQLVKIERPPKQILEYCQELKTSGLNTEALTRATEMALSHGKVDHALEFIKAMKKEGMPIRTHYFWPILARLRNSKNETRIFEVVDSMMLLGTPANYTTFLDYVFDGLDVMDYNTVVGKFKEMGYTAGAVVSPLVEHVVLKKQLPVAAALVQEYFIRLNSGSLVKPLALALKETDDITSTITILKRFRDGPPRDSDNKTDCYGNFIMDYCRACQGDQSKIKVLLQEMLKQGFRISPELNEIVINYLGVSNDHSNSLSQLLSKLVSSSAEIYRDESSVPHPREMSIEDLESHLIELKSKNMNVRGVLRRLLLQHCRGKNLKRVEEIKAELDKEDFVYSGAMYAQLLDLYAHHDKLEEAKNCLTKMKEAQPDFLLDDHKIMNFAAMLVKADQIDEAIKFVTEQEVNPVATKSEGSAWRLLNAAADKGDAELTQNFFDIIVNRKLCEPSNVILGPLIKVHLLKEDATNAIAKFEECCKTYRFTPWRNQLFALLIKSDDADRLQKVMDLNTEIHGEINTMYDLAFAFLDCGRVREARKILETSGLRAKHSRLDSMCDRLIEENRTADLEELVKMTQELFDVDRDQMYYHLLKAYRKEKNHQKALGVWTMMQEEDIRPSNKTLIFLANILKENNQPVPFEIPESTVTPQSTPASQMSQSTIIASILDGNLDFAIEEKRRLESTGGSLNINEESAIIEELIKREQLVEASKLVNEAIDKGKSPPSKVIRFLLMRYAAAGNVEAIKEFDTVLDENAKRRVQYNNILFHAYVMSDRHTEILEILEKDVAGNLDRKPGVSILSLLKKRPELTDRIEKLAEKYANNNYHGMLNLVWTHHFCQENYEKANEIIKSTPYFKEHLAFKKILETAEATKNEEMLKRLCITIKSTSLPVTALARVYTSLLEVQCANNNFDDATKTYKEAKADNADVSLNRITVNRLKTGLLQLGKDVSYIREPSQNRRAMHNVKEESSSSSSSDSDDDRKNVRQ